MSLMMFTRSLAPPFPNSLPVSDPDLPLATFLPDLLAVASSLNPPDPPEPPDPSDPFPSLWRTSLCGFAAFSLNSGLKTSGLARVVYVTFGERLSTAGCSFHPCLSLQLGPWLPFTGLFPFSVMLLQGMVSVDFWNKLYMVEPYHVLVVGLINMSLTLPQYEDNSPSLRLSVRPMLPQYEDITLYLSFVVKLMLPQYEDVTHSVNLSKKLLLPLCEEIMLSCSYLLPQHEVITRIVVLLEWLSIVSGLKSGKIRLFYSKNTSELSAPCLFISQWRFSEPHFSSPLRSSLQPSDTTSWWVITFMFVIVALDVDYALVAAASLENRSLSMVSGSQSFYPHFSTIKFLSCSVGLYALISFFKIIYRLSVVAVLLAILAFVFGLNIFSIIGE